MTSPRDHRVEAYWAAFLESLPEGARPSPTHYQAWGFGDRPETADSLGALVKARVKTATASLIWAYEAEGEPLPGVGEYSIILDGRENPLCVIQTTEITICPFEEVDAEHAYLEGEGDRTLDFWREVHWRFFARECQALGREPNKAMPVLCERFMLVYP
jgi:uncharacterized protein YhfF